MSEKDFQKIITDLCDWLRLTYYHSHDSRRDNPGFPDLVIFGPGGFLFAELKTAKGKTSAKQDEWLFGLKEAGAEVYLWRPQDIETIKYHLKRISRRA